MSEVALTARLDATAALTALVSTRIYAGVLPQDVALPALVFDLLSSARTHAMGSDAEMTRSSYQLTAYAEDFDTARDVIAAARAGLRRYRGTAAGVVVDDVFVGTEQTAFTDALTDPGLHVRTLEIEMIFQAAA